MEFFRINSKLIKSPTSISLSYENLDKSERTMDGTMVVDIIGKKRKVSVSWEYLSKEDMAMLSTEIKASAFSTITFVDNQTGGSITIAAKASDLDYSPHYDWVNSKIMWKSVNISFIER